MSIDAKTRKMLWAKSGNKCVICRTTLIIDGETTAKSSVIGEECHIYSSKPDGPRYNVNYPSEQIDNYENLILLCSVHHKQIDDQCETFSCEILKKMKETHEKWVEEQLSPKDNAKPIQIKRVKENLPTHLKKIITGNDLMCLLNECVAFEYSYDNVFSKEQILLASEFLQATQEVLDIDDTLEVRDKIAYDVAFNDILNELDRNNIWVFGARENRIVTGGVEADDNFPVLILQLLKNDNVSIVRTQV